MKLLTTAVVSVVLLAGGFFGVRAIVAQGSPVKVAPLDLEVLKRTEVQLQNLQLRMQTEAGPIIREHDEKYVYWCTKAGFTTGPNGNCQINTVTGEVNRLNAPPKK